MSSADDKELDEKAIKRLEDASIWLITEVTGKLYSDPSYSKSLQHELIKKFKVTSYNSPKINSGTDILRYIPKSRGIYYDITLLMNVEYMNELYEYWVILISSRKWATKQGKECRFIVTKTPNKTEKRTILKKEQQFFHYFDVDNTRIFSLDYKNNLKLRYKLHPWDYSQCYEKYPEITNEKVVVLRDGSYQVIP